MNRRGFLGTLIGIIISPVASALPPIQWARMGFVPVSEYGGRRVILPAISAGHEFVITNSGIGPLKIYPFDYEIGSYEQITFGRGNL